MKNLVYILGFAAVASLFSCEKDSSFDQTGGAKTVPSNPKDTIPTNPEHQWERVGGNGLRVDDDMWVTSWLDFHCTDGLEDTVYMERWFLDINTTDMIIYKDSYQPTTRSGKTPDAERSDDPEFKDKNGNMVTRHYYTQPFLFNNFTHKINGAWNTGYVTYKGKQEAYLPEDGLYYELVNISGNTVNDTVHFVRNDSIFAREDVKLTYETSFHVVANRPDSWYTWQHFATITVISFVGIVEKIPDANDYIPNLEWHAEHANRFWNGSQWCDGILFSSSDRYYMLVTTFKLSSDGTKETELQTKFYSIAKADMETPSAGREYNAVMWDNDTNLPIPCRLDIDGKGWGLGSRYADGRKVTKRHDREEAVMSGVKNLSENDNATPSPWIATSWTETKYNGVNYYAVTWHTTTHTLARTIADASLK